MKAIIQLQIWWHVYIAWNVLQVRIFIKVASWLPWLPRYIRTTEAKQILQIKNKINDVDRTKNLRSKELEPQKEHIIDKRPYRGLGVETDYIHFFQKMG